MFFYIGNCSVQKQLISVFGLIRMIWMEMDSTLKRPKFSSFLILSVKPDCSPGLEAIFFVTNVLGYKCAKSDQKTEKTVMTIPF